MSEMSSYSSDEENEEDGYNLSSAHYVTAPPSGVLSFHCKKIRHLDENHVVVAAPELYLRIRVGSYTKCTKTFHWTTGAKYVVVHDIKHFSVLVSRFRSDPSNDIRIDLVIVETAHVHRAIGHKEMHLYEIIKNLYLAGTYELKYRQKAVAHLDFEICFAYGIFGYGHSHQLQNRQRKAKDIIRHSFLYRSEPPESRKQTDCITMAPAPMDHPDLISFAQKVEIGSPAVREMLADRYSRFDMDVFSELDKHEPVILARTMRRRLHNIQSDFGMLTSRQERKAFLEKLVLHHGDGSSTHDQNKDQRANTNAPLPDIDQVAAPEAQAYGEDDDHACATDVVELSNFLANAPGIQTRARHERARRPSMSVLREDESVTEFEDEPSTSEVASASTASSMSDALSAANNDRRRSTLAELPGGKFMMSFANKLRLWKSKGSPATPSKPEPVTIVEGPGPTKASKESVNTRNYYRTVKLLKKASHQKAPPTLPD